MFNTFGGNAVSPGLLAYAALALSANTALSWPNFAGVGNVYATIMDVTPSGAGFALTMPDATLTGVGTSALIRNLGGSSFDVKDFSGNTLATVAPGVAKFIWITANATQAGTWGVITFGTGSSAIDASTIVGMGLQVIGATLNQAHPTTLSSTTISITSASLAGVYVATGGSVACNLPTSVSAGNKFFFILKNAGTGTVTVTPSGADTVDGSASVALAPNDACIIYATGGSNAWYTAGLGRNVNFAFTLLTKSVAGSADVTLTSNECANKVINLTGALTGNINVIVTNTVSVYYIFNNTSGAFALTVKTAAGSGVSVAQGTHDVFVCDGTNVYRAVTNTASTTAFSVGSAGSPSITFVGRTDTGMYSPGVGVVALSAAGFEVMSFNAPAASVNWMDAFASATLTNPKLVANGTDINIGLRMQPKGTGKFQLTDGTDTTKVAQLDCSGIATGTVRTITVPDADTKLPIATTVITLASLTAKGDSWFASASGVMSKVTVGSDGQIVKAASGATPGVQWNDDVAALVFIFDGGGAVLTTGVKGDLLIPFGCTIKSATLQADQSGSIVIDIWKKTYTLDSPPTVANTITASAKPTLAAHQSAQDATLTGWTTAIAANDMLRFNIDSITTCTRVTLTLKVTKS